MKRENLFLIGFMGSGKSHWGKIWAERFHKNFLDLDKEIEKEFGMSIEDIFEEHGEDKFRELEKTRLRKIEKNQNMLVSCGGGTPCFADNINWLLGQGKVVYLKAGPSYLFSRVLDEKDKRPLLKKVNHSELIFFIEKKLKQREPVYKQATFTLNAESLNPGSLDEIIKDRKEEKTSAREKPSLHKV